MIALAGVGGRAIAEADTMFDSAGPAAQRVLELLRLDAADELVSDRVLGQRVRMFFTTYDEARAERLSRPANVVDLVEWLERSARKGSLSR